MIYVFDDCSLDSERRELRRRTKLVPLEPQVFDLLVYLISNRERVVSKDNLIAAVWGGRIVSESAISSKVTAVRQAIGDSGEEQRLIKTLPRKGFRFVGAVREVPGPDHSPDGQASAETRRATLTLPDRPSIAVLLSSI